MVYKGFLLRRDFLPKKWTDYPMFVFVTGIIPILTWFQMKVVFVSLFPPPSTIYYVLWVGNLFTLHNIVGNFLALLLCDTSIRGRAKPREDQPGVKFCPICNTLTPPRSFHCPICDVCILKRDHHCFFTSCCVGHFNHRYFIQFVFYLVLCISFCLPFNFYFFWDTFNFNDLSFMSSLVFPIVLMLVDLGPGNIEKEQIYFIMFCIELGGFLFCASWLVLHVKLILRGTIIHEMRRCITFYNLGIWKNIEMVFGKRWHLTWISPLIPSELPCDGIIFPSRNDICKPSFDVDGNEVKIL